MSGGGDVAALRTCKFSKLVSELQKTGLKKLIADQSV